MGFFEQKYNSLNTAQKQAVDVTDGPVLVVAGPGTGKTELLSMRVANILRTVDVDATNILCLTFTNKAAINMRDRLIKLTGGAGQGVMVKTFHSFAAEIMSMYPDTFWNGARLTTAPDVIQSEVISNVLKKLPLSSPLALKFAGSYTMVNDVKNGLRLAKEAGLTPQKLAALANANIAFIEHIEQQVVDILSQTLSIKKLTSLMDAFSRLPQQGIDSSLAPLTSLDTVLKERLEYAINQDLVIGKTTNTGAFKRDVIQTVDGKKGMFKERGRNEWWLALADVYEQYREELHTRGYYDYSDMIIEVISTIEQNPSVRADIQEQFQYVLIDEFQDTNAAQMRLAHLVADHHANNGKPNLMAVGDDDQSIYKFNGAELANMLSFKKSYPDCRIIVLKENYRSSQAVLDTASKIIAQASDRLVLRDPSLSKKLIAVNKPTHKGQIKHQLYADKDQQLYKVCQEIKAIRQSNKQRIAVLARGNESLRQMATILHEHGVPISFSEQHNIIQNEAIQVIYTIGKAVRAIQDGEREIANQQLSQILRHPMWAIKPSLLWELATTNRRNGDWLESLLSHTDTNLNTIGLWLQWLAAKADTENAVTMINYIAGLTASQHITSPLKAYFMQTDTPISAQYVQDLSAIRNLIVQTHEYSSRQNPDFRNFINYLETSIDSNVIIGDESSFISGHKGVELLTVHKAKGLEFDVVYVVDVIDTNWSPSKRGRRSPLNLPLQPAFDDLDDYIRLLYVAATRAKHSLIFTSYSNDVSGGDVLTSPLLSAIIEPAVIKPTSLPEAASILEVAIQWPRLKQDDEKKNLQSIIENYSLSASGLLDFLDVSRGGPRYFLEKHLLRLPEATSPSMAFGIAIHSALELAQILTNRDAFTIEHVTQHFSQNLSEQLLSLHDFKRFNAHGIELLTKLFESESFWLPKGSLPEQSISDIRIGSARLTGKLDRIDKRNDSLIVVDYKTGSPLSSFTTKSQSQAVKAWRHRTQLTFYALLLKESGRFKSSLPIRGQMIYLEASQSKELVREYQPSDDDIDQLKKLILAMWPIIHNLNLPDVSQYEQNYEGIQSFQNSLLN